MMKFSKSLVEKFRHNNKHVRYGQAIHQFLKLEKVTGPEKGFCDKLYNEPDEAKARDMVRSRTDPTQ